MEDSQDGMPFQHARARIPHHGLDLVAHLHLEAVNGAFRAGWFLILEPAGLESAPGIGLQCAAILAQDRFMPVVVTAVHPDHSRHCFLLSFNSGGEHLIEQSAMWRHGIQSSTVSRKSSIPINDACLHHKSGPLQFRDVAQGITSHGYRLSQATLPRALSPARSPESRLRPIQPSLQTSERG